MLLIVISAQSYSASSSSRSPRPGPFRPSGRAGAFSAGGRLLLIAGQVAGKPTADGDAWTELADAGELASIRIALSAAAPLGHWRPIATIFTGERLSGEESQALRFDAWRCDGGLVPWGLINRLREPAYRGQPARQARNLTAAIERGGDQAATLCGRFASRPRTNQTAIIPRRESEVLGDPRPVTSQDVDAIVKRVQQEIGTPGGVRARTGEDLRGTPALDVAKTSRPPR